MAARFLRNFLLGLSIVSVKSGILVSSDDGGPTVPVSSGLLQGYTAEDRFNRSYDAFLGVPFAQPPVGELRWAPPQRPAESWTGIRNATEFAPHCIQIFSEIYDLYGLATNESEDCLYLNVYVPGSVEDALENTLPVMFFYYGGGYLFGTSAMYPAQELATDQNVIVITTTYRTGVLGFLSTEDSACPGNYGLWDGKAALEWTVENIAAFGGDPQMITVFGQSAGAGMTMHSVLSPQTNGLFQRAIAISGSATAITSFTLNARKSSQYLADVFFCNTTDSEEIVACLMEVDAKTLDLMSLIAPVVNQSRSPDYVPVIDNDFVIQDTRKSLEQGLGSHIDLTTGHTLHDSAGLALGNSFGLPPIVNFTRWNRTHDGNQDSQYFHDMLVFMLGSYSDEPEALYQVLLNRYPDLNSTDNEVCSKTATDITTKWWFSSGTHYDATGHARGQGGGNTFVYRFEYRQSFLTGYPDWVNGSHLDDLYCVFSDPYLRPFRENFMDVVDFSQQDELVGKNVRNRFGNIAHTGNPNLGPNSVDVTWPDYGDSGEILVQSTSESVTSLSQEERDELLWYVDVWWPLLKPIWRESEDDGGVEVADRIPFDENEFLDAADQVRHLLHESVGDHEEMVLMIDDIFSEALWDRERYR